MTGRTRQPPSPGTATQVSHLYGRIRADLLAGRLPPGRKLRVRSLMEAYGAGQTPIREALNRLAAETLVDSWDQRGFTVARISRETLVELTRTRCWIEEVALRQAMAHADAAWREALLLAAGELALLPRSLDPARYQENPAWEQSHATLHRLLIERCGSKPLLEFCGQLTDQLYRYRQLSVRTIFPRRDIVGEHKAIVETVVAGDADDAVRLLTAHYRLTADIILDDDALFGPDATTDSSDQKRNRAKVEA